MGLEAKHPLFTEFAPIWVDMRILYKGERAVKAAGVDLLKPTASMELDGMELGNVGLKDYERYKTRAVCPDDVKEAVEFYMGLLHSKPASIELPAVMEPLRERATINGESLQMLLSRITEEQLVVGRIGLLADMPAIVKADNMPYIAIYVAESINNWDDGSYREGFNSLNLVVLNESGFKRGDDFSWALEEKYRVLQLGTMAENEAKGAATYVQGTFESNGYNEAQMLPPMYRGATLDQIPFVFINTKDIVAAPDEPPLNGLGNTVLAIYRGEADYRQNLHMQGQDTLVVIGGVHNSSGDPEEDDDAIRVGAGSRLELDNEGDAKYIGVSPNGLSEQRTCLENDRKIAANKSGHLTDTKGSSKESGDALHIRMGAKTASLKQIALSSAGGLQHILRIVAVWMGANEEEVIVTPNLEFTNVEINAKEYVELMTARSMGAPLSLETIHARMAEKGLTKMDFETELQKVEEENAQLGLGMGTGAGGPKEGDEE